MKTCFDSFLLAIVLGASALLVSPLHLTARAEPGQYLLAADTAANELYVYDIPSMRLTGQVDNVKLGSHMGTVTLPDGRILMVDDLNAQFVALKIDEAGKPVVVSRIAIPGAPSWNRAAWGAVDPGFRYFAFSSDEEGSATQTVTLVNLDDYSAASAVVPLNANRNGSYEELHVYLAGNPLNVFLTTGEQVRSYPISDFLSGNVGTPASVQPIPPNSHGPGIQQGTQRLYSCTADGMAALDITAAQLQTPRLVPWNVRNITASQDFRPRLSFDGGWIYGAVTRTPAPAAEAWADTQNFIHATDLRSEKAKLIPLAYGSVGRYALSTSFALFWNVHPKGDNAYLLDINPASSTFQQVVTRISLPKLTNGPVAGAPLAGKQSRAGTVTPDGRWAFVSQGGDSTVLAIDTTNGRIAGTMPVPTSMSGGGYLVAVQPGTPLLDTHAR